MPAPIDYSAALVDLSPRFQSTGTIAASPATAAETVIATLNLSDFGNLNVTSGIRVQGFVSFTVGTSGTQATVQIKQTNASGTAVQTTGAFQVTAGTQAVQSIIGFDTTPGIKSYALTLTVTPASAASTVAAVHLAATVI